MGAMTTMTCRYEGQLRCQAVHVASAAELLTDAPLAVRILALRHRDEPEQLERATRRLDRSLDS